MIVLFCCAHRVFDGCVSIGAASDASFVDAVVGCWWWGFCCESVSAVVGVDEEKVLLLEVQLVFAWVLCW